MWFTMATLCASAQFETTVSVGVKEGAYGTYHVSYNFEDVCQSLGVEPEEFGHILEVWLDPYPTVNWPDEYSKYESQKYMYLMTGDGRQVMGRQHRSFYLSDNGGLATPDEEYWTCVISIDRRRNRLDFGFDVAYDISDWAFSHEPKPKGKIGDTFRYTFGIENEGKQATFDITLNMVPEFGGNTLPIDSFEKVGEQEVKLKYQSGKTTHTTRLNLEEIAKAFGGNVRGGNLGLYLMKKLVPGAMTDRFIYCRQPSMLLSDWMAENYYYGDPRALYMVYVPETGELILYPGDESNFEKGEHLTGSAYLVAEGKCYELKLDLQIGDSKQETRNMAVVEKAEPCGTFSRTLTVAPESGAGGERFESRASFSLPVLAKALGADCTELTEAIKYWMKGNNQKDGTEIIYNLTDHASSEYSPWGPGSFMMTKGGKTVKRDGDYTWIMEVDGAMNELQFNLWQEFGKLTDGDVCHTRLGLYYKGRMVTLDLTLIIRTENQNGTGDNYQSYVQEGKTWKMGWFGEGTMETQQLEYHYLKGDTVLMGIQCKKMMSEQVDAEGCRTSYLAAVYENSQKVYAFLPNAKESVLIYDFTGKQEDVSFYSTWQGRMLNSLSRGSMSDTSSDRHKGVLQYIYEDDSLIAYWLNGIGYLGFYNAGLVSRDGMQLYLMECTVGDEVLYCDEVLRDGLSSNNAEVRKNKLDFSHVIKSQPRTPRRRANEYSNNLITGEYTAQSLYVNFTTLCGAYTVALTSIKGDVVYIKQVQTDNVLALDIDLSGYDEGDYTLTVENDHETYTAAISLKGGSGVDSLTPSPSSIERGTETAVYDLQGRKLNAVPQRGLYIQGGKKIVKR